MEAITNEEDMAQAIEDAMTDANDGSIRSIRSFSDAGLLTRDTGLVVRLRDGSEYQITIARSK